MSFADLGVSRPLVDALKRRGITRPFPIQELVIGDVLAGNDVLVQSPTGSGKTLAFGVPIAQRLAQSDRAPAALVLVPTRELAAQIVEELEGAMQSRNLRIAAVYGGVGIQKQAKNAARAQVIVATPDINESRMLCAWLEAEGFDAVPRSTPKSACDAVVLQPFDLLIADAGFVLTGGVRGFGLARFRETPVIDLQRLAYAKEQVLDDWFPNEPQ